MATKQKRIPDRVVKMFEEIKGGSDPKAMAVKHHLSARAFKLWYSEYKGWLSANR